MKKTANHSHSNTTKNHAHKGFDVPEMFAEMFDGPEREEWQKSHEVIASLNLPENAVVVDLGAGTGFFTVRFSEHLKHGKVIALDTEPKMTGYLKKRVIELGLQNVEVREAMLGDDINLQEKIDLILCVDVYHHIPKSSDYFSKLLVHLKSEGKLVIIDRVASSSIGSHHAHHMTPKSVKLEMKQAGFELAQEFDFLLPEQFYLMFKPNSAL